MIGRVISHYRILAKLGQGGMGEVYKAEDTGLRRTVALKFLSPEALGSEEARARFMREARMAASLNHPNVCTVYEVGSIRTAGPEDSAADGPHAPRPFIAMELLEGETLGELYRSSGRLDNIRIIDVAVQVAEGLAAAHAKGIVHRDLKPQNVIVLADGRVKILDFGLAKPITFDARDQEADDAVTESMPMTHPGLIIGTVSYMSPEQAAGKPLDSRSDIFTFGIMLYEMVTGKRPFRGDTPTETLAKILEGEPEPPSSITRALPPELDRIIRRCLKKDPRDRYNDTRDLVAALRELRATDESSRAVAVRSRMSRRRFLIRGVSVLVIVAAALLLLRWWITRPPSGPTEIRATRIGGEDFGSVQPRLAISPDGRFIAYAARADLSLAVVSSGEVQTLLPQEKERRFTWVEWHPDGERLLTEEWTAGRFEIWLTHVVTRRREPIRESQEVTFPAISPDGQTLALLCDRGRTLRVAPVNGEDEWPVVRVGELETITPPTWGPAGARLAYVVRRDPDALTTLETVDLDGNRSVLLEDTGIALSTTPTERVCWLADGRLIYDQRTGTSASALRVIDVDPESGRLRGGPRELFSVAGAVSFDFPTASADGQRLAFLQSEQVRRLVMLDTSGGVENPDLRPITVDDWPGFPGVWTPDGQSILFASERKNGDLDIYVRDLSARREVPFVVSPRLEDPQCLSPDKSHLWYMRDRDLMSIPLAGGVSRRVLSVGGENPIVGVRSATMPDSTGVYAALEGPELVLTSFSIDGRVGAELLRVKVDAERLFYTRFDLSPNGAQIAVTEWCGRLRVFDLQSRQSRELLGSEWGGHPQSVYWSPAGDALYLSGMYGLAEYWVIRVDMEGTVEVLWKSVDTWVCRPVPSPSERLIVMQIMRMKKDIWMIEGF